jgi:tetratricopeptide (TPR) repeat protein
MELWLKLLSLIEADPQSPGYKEIARFSIGEPLSEIYTQLASAYLKLDRYEEALKAARKAMEGKARLKECVHVYAHCEIIAGSPDKASAALEDLLKATPDYPPSLFLKAVTFCLEGKKEKSLELFQLLHQKQFQVTPLINTIVKESLANGKRDEALLILNATIENNLNDQETMSLYDSLHHNRSSA